MRDKVVIFITGGIFALFLPMNGLSDAQSVSGATQTQSFRLASTNFPKHITSKLFDKREDGGVNLLDAPPRRRKSQMMQLFDSLTDETVFFRLGDDVLTWGQVKKNAQATFSRSVTPPPGLDLTEEEIEDTKKRLFINVVNKMMRNYLRAAVIAHVAREKGLTVSDADYQTAKDTAIKAYARRGKLGAPMLKEVETPGSFFAHNATNVILATAYFEKHVKPSVIITDEDADKIIRDRIDYNASVAPSNRLVRAELEKILADIRKHEIDFAEAANLHSEDGGDNGYFGVFEPGEGMKELEEVYSKMKPGDISDVVETPYSYHVLKLLKKNYEKDSNECANTNKIENYELAHIMLEKYRTKPEITKDDARKYALNIAASRKFKELQLNLLKSLPIKCVVPLTGERSEAVKNKKPLINKKGKQK